MNNVAADVEIMPAVVSSIFSLIPSPPAPFFLGKKRHLSCWMRGTPEIVGQTRWMGAEKCGEIERTNLKMKRGGGVTDGKKKAYI